jgi:hypothetical protein
MPYTYEIENRRRVKRAVAACLILAALALLVLAPSKMLGWAGMAFAAFEPASHEAPLIVEEKAQGPAAKVPSTPSLPPLTFPAFAEWSDVSEFAPCAGCDWHWELGIDSGVGELGAVDNGSAQTLGPASSLGTGGANGFRRSGRASRSGAGGVGGGGGGGGGSASGNAPAEAVAEAGASESATEAVTAAEASANETVASTTASTRPAPGGGSAYGSGATPNNPSGSSRGNNAGGNPVGEDTADDNSDESSAGAGPGTGQAPDNLLLADLPAFAPEQGGPGAGAASPSVPSAGGLPADVERALLNSPPGTETVLSPDEPEVISAALNLDEGSGEQQATIPEPSSLLLMGLALSTAAWRKRHSRA